MAIPVQAIFTIVNAVIPAIKTAEQFFRGKKEGEKKKDAVVSGIVAQLFELLESLGNSATSQIPDGVGWVKSLVSTDEGKEKLGDLIDAIVGLMNFINKNKESF